MKFSTSDELHRCKYKELSHPPPLIASSPPLALVTISMLHYYGPFTSPDIAKTTSLSTQSFPHRPPLSDSGWEREPQINFSFIRFRFLHFTDLNRRLFQVIHSIIVIPLELFLTLSPPTPQLLLTPGDSHLIWSLYQPRTCWKPPEIIFGGVEATTTEQLPRVTQPPFNHIEPSYRRSHESLRWRRARDISGTICKPSRTT